MHSSIKHHSSLSDAISTKSSTKFCDEGCCLFPRHCTRFKEHHGSPRRNRHQPIGIILKNITTLFSQIDVVSFYQQNVRPDLLFGSSNEMPILRSDALKYLVLFRNQLSTDQILECFRGENGRIGSSIIRLFSSNNFLLHHYLAYAVERILLMKVPDTQVWNNEKLRKIF